MNFNIAPDIAHAGISFLGAGFIAFLAGWLPFGFFQVDTHSETAQVIYAIAALGAVMLGFGRLLFSVHKFNTRARFAMWNPGAVPLLHSDSDDEIDVEMPHESKAPKPKAKPRQPRKPKADE